MDNDLNPQKTPPSGVHRIVVAGGGFGGFYTSYHLEKSFKNHPDTEITLISENNYFLMTPLLFEAGSGVLEPRHAVNPLRTMLKKARFVEARIEAIDFDQRKVFATHFPDNYRYELQYDQLILALGGVTNRKMIPGSEHAIGFKTLADAIFLRNRIIDLFEQADVETDEARRRKLLTLVLIGGGLVGVELLGELTDFVENLLRSYPRIPKHLPRFVLIEAAERVLPEMEESLANYAANVLKKRGVELLTKTKVSKIEVERVFLPGEGGAEKTIDAKTILLTAGLGANPLLETFPLAKANNGRIVVEPTMRCKERPEVWALGDCASIPDKTGKAYPPLAQHALREAKVMARNVAAARRAGPNQNPPLEAFVYETLGMLASLGTYNGVGRVWKFKVRGFIAWWVWRTYYVMQMPRWDRRLRVIIDWTIALFFKNDVVKLDLFGEEHPVDQTLHDTVAPPKPDAPVENVG
jgi:NADH dehydrogenase